ncbi:protein kinase [Trichocoleus sp. FACHB-591]|uniref:protein kinase domain-containing protein n=1 Tax=Trichocoleus sp. FACHB-591 TaxID=2692872 RepID=UPI00168737FA|nr:serine/threonine-protein kinase [Trichocoleus sp. FACHB-591]MBD2096761.1 protein kinase [Trichocoleus sp. FACHB-591]
MEVYFEKPIGNGTFADVWLGTDEIGRSVAIKVLRESKNVSTVLQHAQALVRAKHPNVVEIYSIEKLQVPGQGKEQCIVMEYVNGCTLAEKFCVDLELKEAFDIGKAIISEVQYIHAQGLAHMDLHGENILITKEGDVKIIDIMYMSSLSEASDKVKFNCLSSDTKQLIELLSQLLTNSPFGKEAKSYFLESLDDQINLNDIRRNYFDIFTIVSEKIEYMIDFLKVNPVKLKLYKFRAECESDTNSLQNILKEEAVSISKSKQYFPDVEVRLVTTLTLDEIRQRMRAIEDSHVMIQTISHHLDYTGERDYDLI